jgi:hypothetical protein
MGKNKGNCTVTSDDKHKQNPWHINPFRYLENEPLVDGLYQDIPTGQVICIYKDYLTLQGMSLAMDTGV